MKKNRLIAILMAAAITLTYMPAMAYGGSEEGPQNEGAILEESLDAGVTDAEAADPAETEEPSDSPAVQPEEEEPADIPEDTSDEAGSPEKEPSNEDALSEEKSSVTLNAQSESGWGPWSAWQDEAVSGSATRQVETRSVIDSYEMDTYTYTDSGSPSGRGFWPTSQGDNYRFHFVTTWPASVMNSRYGTYPAGTYYNPSIQNAGNVAGMIHGATAYVSATVDSYHPMFIKKVNYKTQYRFRDTKTTTPECSKTIPRITSATISWTQPAGDITGYEVQYSTSSQFKNCKKVIVKGGSNCRCKLTGLKPGTVYYIRIRVYVVVNGKAVYKKWGSTFKVKTCTKAGNLTSIKWSGVKSCTYTGKPLKRTFTIVRKGVTLVEGRDYTVTYKNNTRVGTATIIVKGCGKYFGTITRTFRILPGKTTMSKCTGKSKAVTVRWSRRSRNCSGYQVRYCTRSDFKNCKYKTVKGRNTGSCTISGLKPFTKYYIEVRIYCVVGGRNYYSAWSDCSAVSTKADGYRILPVAYTIEYPSHDGDYFDGIKSADIELTYNKYGLVDKMIVYVNSVYGRYKEVKQFKYTFYDNKSVRTLTLPYRTVSMNRNGAITKATRGGWGSYKGKATYYSGTDKLKSMELSSTEFNHRYRYYFDKAGYMTGYTSNNSTMSRTINSKGLCTSKVYKSGGGNIYEYTFKNGKVAARKDYYSNNSGDYIYDKTITVKKWKKVKTYDKSRRSARCITAFLDMVHDEGDKDLDYPSFVYEWK